MPGNISDLILGGDTGTQLLQQAFAFDITLAKIRCEACNSVTGLGSLILDGGPAEVLVRCSCCESTLIGATRTREGLVLDVKGVRQLYF
jgi:hypothetical protein